MSLMLKLLAATLILSSSLLYANDAEVISFLKKGIGANPNIVSLDIKIVEKVDLERPLDWQAYVIQLDGVAKMGSKTQPISQRTIYFVGDDFITAELYDLKTGEKLNASISPEFKEKYYDESHLLFGDKNAAHKAVIFSDPLCPFCRTFVPKAFAYMKQYPKTFAVYYYHFPLRTLHPAAIPLVKAAFAAEKQGQTNVVEALYKVNVDGREKDTQKVLDAFNAVQGTKITLSDISKVEIQRHLDHDMAVAQEHLVNGTPTLFFDGKKDPTKLEYTNVKLIK